MISVIMPVYNAKNSFLEISINSILEQSYRYFELIIVDDGSNGECANKLDELARLDKRIKLYHKQNSGVSSSRNFAISQAIGEFITFIDSDDMINKYFFEEAIELMSEYKLEMIIGKHNKVSKWDECNPTVKSINSKLHLFYGADVYKVQGALLTNEIKEFSKGVSGMQCCKVYKLDIVRGINIPINMIVSEDQFWNLLILENIHSVGVCDNLWYYYLQHESSASHTYGLSDLSTHYPYWKELANFIENKVNSNEEFKQYYYSKMVNEYYSLLLNYYDSNYSNQLIQKNMREMNSMNYFKISFNNISIDKCTKKEKTIIYLKKIHLLNFAVSCFVRLRKIIRKK